MANDSSAPGKVGGVARFGCGGFFALICLIGWLQQAAVTAGLSVLFSVLLAFALRWLVVGPLALFGKWPARKFSYGAAALGALLLMAVGPSASRAFWASEEPRAWEKVKSDKSTHNWQESYIKPVVEPMRRPGWRSRYAEARAATAVKNRDFTTLRLVSQDIFGKAAPAYDDDSRKAVSDAYDGLFKEGLDKIKAAKGADPKLQAGFAALLNDLKSNPTNPVVLDFSVEGAIASRPDDQAFLSSSPAGKLPILPVGDSLSADSRVRRAAAVQADLKKSFDNVFPKGLLDVQSQGGNAAEQVHLKISAKTTRLPGFYVNSEEKKGVRTQTDLLYKMSVHWKCQLVGLNGKNLGEFELDSEPAKHVSYSTSPSDPKWAPYSIMLDSASDNFARLVMIRLGLPAPKERDHYSFIK